MKWVLLSIYDDDGNLCGRFDVFGIIDLYLSLSLSPTKSSIPLSVIPTLIIKKLPISQIQNYLYNIMLISVKNRDIIKN